MIKTENQERFVCVDGLHWKAMFTDVFDRNQKWRNDVIFISVCHARKTTRKQKEIIHCLGRHCKGKGYVSYIRIGLLQSFLFFFSFYFQFIFCFIHRLLFLFLFLESFFWKFIVIRFLVNFNFLKKVLFVYLFVFASSVSTFFFF